MLKYLLLGVLVLAACGGDDDGGDDVVYQIPVQGQGMAPTLADGDRIDVHRYQMPIAVGDVIVFAAPISPDRDFIKRVIAVPGQTVEIDPTTGNVTVDGVQLEEPYIQGGTACGVSCVYIVPTLDNSSVAPNGLSTQRGLLSDPDEEDAECRRTGCVFVLGDNRQNSSDSRQGWMVPVENIIGRIEEP